jgi:uncharacterized repeat protein (TIGR03803 family)
LSDCRRYLLLPRFAVLLISTAGTSAQTSPPALTTLATFHGAAPNLDGIDPLGVMVGSGGVVYGVTQSGGTTNNGTVFSLTPPKSAGGPEVMTAALPRVS